MGEHELIHLIEAPTLLDVPLSPLLPAGDPVERPPITGDGFGGLAMGREQPVQPARKLAGVVAYQPRMGAAEYGVLLLTIFQRARVSPTPKRKLPEQPTGWRDLAISCFLDAETSVPIRIFP